MWRQLVTRIDSFRESSLLFGVVGDISIAIPNVAGANRGAWLARRRNGHILGGPCRKG